MTAAQQARSIGFKTSLQVRGVPVILQPQNLPLLALVEVADEGTRKRLQLADDSITHIVHLERNSLLGVDYLSVSVIERADTESSYRVKHFTDDPQRPAVLFHSVLA